MGFGGNSGGGNGLAKTQDDLVKANTEARPTEYTEEVTFPGIKVIHTMSQEELKGFFLTVLKARTLPKGMDLTLGDKYEYTEEVSRMPGTADLHTRSFDEVSQILALVLMANPMCIGFKVEVVTSNEGENNMNVFSKVTTRIGKKDAQGPMLDEEGNVIEGDEEFDPKLRITYRPNF